MKFLFGLQEDPRIYISNTLPFWEKIWWRFMPGVIINVRWPAGQVKVGQFQYLDSSDPNDHYRPWLEKHIGKQGWDWNWGLGIHDVSYDMSETRLTIKIRNKHKLYATIIAMRWL